MVARTLRSRIGRTPHRRCTQTSGLENRRSAALSSSLFWATSKRPAWNSTSPGWRRSKSSFRPIATTSTWRALLTARDRTVPCAKATPISSILSVCTGPPKIMAGFAYRSIFGSRSRESSRATSTARVGGFSSTSSSKGGTRLAARHSSSRKIHSRTRYGNSVGPRHRRSRPARAPYSSRGSRRWPHAPNGSVGRPRDRRLSPSALVDLEANTRILVQGGASLKIAIEQFSHEVDVLDLAGAPNARGVLGNHHRVVSVLRQPVSDLSRAPQATLLATSVIVDGRDREVMCHL